MGDRFDPLNPPSKIVKTLTGSVEPGTISVSLRDSLILNTLLNFKVLLLALIGYNTCAGAI